MALAQEEAESAIRPHLGSRPAQPAVSAWARSAAWACRPANPNHQYQPFRLAAGELQEAPFRRLPGVTGMRVKETKEAEGGGYLLTVSEIGAALPALLAELERQNLKLNQLTTHQATLEDVFVNLTGRMLRDG